MNVGVAVYSCLVLDLEAIGLRFTIANLDPLADFCERERLIPKSNYCPLLPPKQGMGMKPVSDPSFIRPKQHPFLQPSSVSSQSCRGLRNFFGETCGRSALWVLGHTRSSTRDVV